MIHQPLPSQIGWTHYHQSVRRIVAKFNPVHGNYRIHDHEFVEIAAITKGSCLHQTALGDTRAGPGDVFLFRPGAWHGYAEAKDLAIYNCCFDTALLGRELIWMADEPLLGRLLWSIPLSPEQHGMVSLHLHPDAFCQCCKVLDDLCALAKVDYLTHHGDHIGLLVQLLSVLARNVSGKPKKKSSKSHRVVTVALKMMEENPTEQWTLTSLAARSHVEPTYLVRLFREVVGLPPMAYLTRKRLELATNLLRQDNLPVGEVGAQSGWPDANYFSRCFRQHFGMTPSRYRARFLAGRNRD